MAESAQTLKVVKLPDDPFRDGALPERTKYQTSMSAALDSLAKNYLADLYYGKKTDSKIKVTRFAAMNNFFVPFVGKAEMNNTETGYCNFNDLFTFVDVEHCPSRRYFFVFKSVLLGTENANSRISIQSNNLYIAGESPNLKDCAWIANYIFKQSVKNSTMKNRCFVYDSSAREADILSQLKVFTPEPVDLKKDIFIPAIKMREVERYIHAVKRYKKEKISLNYLFAGPPGTGKTKLINGIILAVKGSVTIIVCSGKFPIREIYNLGKLFESVLLVVDDLDLLIGARDRYFDREALANFLSLLDGFTQNNIFLLATTNLKELVDYAGRRPGRFDVILDLAAIEPVNYLDLIKRKTNDEEIIALFDQQVLEGFKIKKATGAMITNLVKQLESLKRYTGNVIVKDLNELFELLYKGFQSSNGEEQSKIGFM